MGRKQGLQVGDRFKTNNNGDLEVVSYTNNTTVGVRFFDTGFERVCTVVNIKSGKVSDPFRPSIAGVGFLGVGKYGANRLNGKGHHPDYVKWCSMISRCYSDRAKVKSPSYADCFVCDEWHNFQNFAEWFHLNYPLDGKDYQLDKDLKISGNKEYKPEACSFVSHKLNARAARAKVFMIVNPDGELVEVQPSIDEFCRVNNLGAHSIGDLARGLKPKGHYKGWTMPDKEFN